MIRQRWYVGVVMGVAGAAAGWVLGGFAGSLMWRSLAAAAVIAGLHGLALHGARGAVIVTGVGTMAATLGYLVGSWTVTPLAAWPALGAVLGLASAWSVPSIRRKALLVAAGAALVSAVFVVGLMAVAFAGFARNDGALLSQLFFGGAIGAGTAPALLIALGRRLARSQRRPGHEAVAIV